MNEKEFIKSDNPIIQKCLDIIYSGNFKIAKVHDFDNYVVYLKYRNFVVSKISNPFNLKDIQYKLDIDGTLFLSHKQYSGLNFADISELYNLCVLEYNKREKQRIQSALDYIDNFGTGMQPNSKSHIGKAKNFWSRLTKIIKQNNQRG